MTLVEGDYSLETPVSICNSLDGEWGATSSTATRRPHDRLLGIMPTAANQHVLPIACEQSHSVVIYQYACTRHGAFTPRSRITRNGCLLWCHHQCHGWRRPISVWLRCDTRRRSRCGGCTPPIDLTWGEKMRRRSRSLAKALPTAALDIKPGSAMRMMKKIWAVQPTRLALPI